MSDEHELRTEMNFLKRRMKELTIYKENKIWWEREKLMKDRERT